MRRLIAPAVALLVALGGPASAQFAPSGDFVPVTKIPNVQVTDSGSSRTMLVTDAGKQVNMTNASRTTITVLAAATAGAKFATLYSCDAGCTLNHSGSDTFNDGSTTSLVIAPHRMMYFTTDGSASWRIWVLGEINPFRTVTASPTIGAGDLNGVIYSNVSGGGTLTVPAANGTFIAGSSVQVTNYSASTEAVSTTSTINAGGGCVSGTGIPSGATWAMTSNGTSIDCAQLIPSGSSGAVSLSATGQSFTGGIIPTAFSNGTATTGTKTIDCGNGPIQTLTNGGAFTFAMATNDGSCVVRVTNNGSAGAITFSGFSEGSNTGDTLDTTNTDIFDIALTRIGGHPHYLVSALQ